MGKKKFKPGLFVFRYYVCEQNEPSFDGVLVYASSLNELKQKMLDEFKKTFGEEEEDKEKKGSGEKAFWVDEKWLEKEMNEYKQDGKKDEDDGDESEDGIEFNDDCSYSDYEVGDGQNFVLVDSAPLPDGFKLVRKKSKRRKSGEERS